MAFYNEFPGDRSYDGDLGWLLQQVRPLIEGQAALAADFANLKAWITKQLTDNEQIAAMVEEYLNSQAFEDMVSSAVDAQYLGNPDSVVSTNIQQYDSDQNAADMLAVANAYSNLPVQVVRIGYSYLGKPIYAYLIGNNTTATHRGCIVGQMHANEIHTSQLINRMVEFLLYNWFRPFDGTTADEVFRTQTFLLVIPMLNPDGADLVVNGMDDLAASLQAVIQNAINRDMVKYWNLSDTTWRSSLNPNPNGAVYDEQGNMVSYTYQAGDEKNWKSNLQGIDLHYNCYDAGTVDAYGTQAVIEAGTGAYTARFAMLNSINDSYSTSGWTAAENAVFMAALNAYDCKSNLLDIHGRTPYIGYNYNQSGAALKRNYYAALEMGMAGHVKVRDSSTPSRVGTPGWFAANGAGIVLNAEIGWLRFSTTAQYPDGIDISGNYDAADPLAYCPLSDGQEPYLYSSLRDWALRYAVRFVAGRDYAEQPHVELTQLEKRAFQPVLTSNGVPADSYGSQQGYMYRLTDDLAYLHVHVEGTWTEAPTSGTTLQLSELPLRLSRAAGTQQYIPLICTGITVASTARQIIGRVNTSDSRHLDIIGHNLGGTSIQCYPSGTVAVYIDAMVRIA